MERSFFPNWNLIPSNDSFFMCTDVPKSPLLNQQQPPTQQHLPADHQHQLPPAQAAQQQKVPPINPQQPLVQQQQPINQQLSPAHQQQHVPPAQATQQLQVPQSNTVRNLPVVALVKALCYKVVSYFDQRRVEIQKQVVDGNEFTKYADKIMSKWKERATGHHVTKLTAIIGCLR
ncbi:hypothetical protein POM88_028608 [Heracleum sosnowskyi]|uniref:Uncharacterized protein n=1 Tax=Heracleum sosnowskyi TaxID=360622 RepID=A0AAD8HUP0_9APIA|nr:hypothetical protein POM88_028608 [Heracleum sosnowskyi]